MDAYHSMLQSPFHPDNIRDFGDLREQRPVTQKLSRVDELKAQIRTHREMMVKLYLGGCRYQAMQQYRSMVYLRSLLKELVQ